MVCHKEVIHTSVSLCYIAAVTIGLPLSSRGETEKKEERGAPDDR